VILRVGVSFVSADQACANAEEEIGTTSFENIQLASKALWQEKLSKIEIDVANTPTNVRDAVFVIIPRITYFCKRKSISEESTISCFCRIMLL